jgi:subtilisin family serine protease
MRTLSRPTHRTAVVLAAVALLWGSALVVARATASAPARPASAPGRLAGNQTRIVVRLAGPGLLPSSLVSAIRTLAHTALPGNRLEVTVPKAEVTRLLARLNHLPGVMSASAQHVWRSTAAATPNDPDYLQHYQDNLTAVHAPAAWAITHGGVPVAVLDSGVDTAHPDLASKLIQPGETLCFNNPTGRCSAWNSDPYGHGTFSTGIIAGATNNGIGMAGAGWDTKVKMFKILADDGNGSTIDVASAIINAANEGFRVINLSLSGPSCQADASNCGADYDTQSAIQYAQSKGVVVVAAAGNGKPGDNGVTYPAGYAGVVSVGATDNAGTIQWFSQYGPWVLIAAPGLFIDSTMPGGASLGLECYSGTISPTDSYDSCSGTSFAAPEVAATAALVFSAHPSLAATDVVRRLTSTAQPVTGGNPIGGGMLDMGRAVG